MALNLFGVTFSEATGREAPVAGTELVVVRDLAAIVAPAPYHAIDATDERVELVTELIAPPTRALQLHLFGNTKARS